MKKIVVLFAIIITIVGFIVWNGSFNSPQKSTNAFLKNIQKGNWKSASSYIKNSDAKEYFLEETQDKYNGFVFKKIKYEIGKIKKDDKQASISVKIIAIDKRKAQDIAFEKIRKEILEKDSIESHVVDTIPYVLKVVESPSAEKVTLPVKIKLVKVGDEWKVDLTEDFMDALTGTYDRRTDKHIEFERIDSTDEK
ncbi:hypothetical protein [Gottfriedia solisilvae]|uniref:hypothetical protein n=1 Tax=Gottfriedia solisilvae TaxID=1516104 RepID=UPI003D2EEA97